jgi:hypothetical protein
VDELPADLVVHDLWSAWGRQAGGFDGIRGGAQCVRTHVADGHGLTGGSGSGSGCGSLDLVGRHATDEAPANLLGSVELSSGERPSASDGGARAVVSWSAGLKQAEHPLCAIRSPCGDLASFGLAERLRRSHHRSLHSRPFTAVISATDHQFFRCTGSQKVELNKSGNGIGTVRASLDERGWAGTEHGSEPTSSWINRPGVILAAYTQLRLARGLIADHLPSERATSAGAIDAPAGAAGFWRSGPAARHAGQCAETVRTLYWPAEGDAVRGRRPGTWALKAVEARAA